MFSNALSEKVDLLRVFVPQTYPLTVWYFSNQEPAGSFMQDSGEWSCVYSNLREVIDGKRVCFSAEKIGCKGASAYFGFSAPGADSGQFLAEKEKYKKNKQLGDAFYKELDIPNAKARYLVWSRLDTAPDDADIEVVNLWLTPESLAAMVTLANYDRADNDNVLTPFASGCQSLWTYPYMQKNAGKARCIIGGMDPTVRKYLSHDTLTFSIPANRFAEMLDNLSGSFLEERLWQELIA